MLCEKCGKNNSDSVTVCKHCGALMPQKTNCGGFSDILSYEAKRNLEQNAEKAGYTNPGYASDAVARRVQMIEQEMNAKMRVYKKKIKSATLLASIGLTVGVVALVASFVYNPHAAEIKTLKKEVAMLKQQSEQVKIVEAEMPEGDLMQDLNDFYSVSSEQVKQNEEAWKKANEAPVPEETVQVPEAVTQPIDSEIPAEAPIQQDAQ